MSQRPATTRLLLIASFAVCGFACTTSDDVLEPSNGAGGAAGVAGGGGPSSGGAANPPGTGGTSDPPTGGFAGSPSGTGGAPEGGAGGSGNPSGGSGGSAGVAGAGGGQGGTGGTSTPSGFVSCPDTPVSCDDIGGGQDAQYYGCCDGGTVYWCDDQSGAWELHSADCLSSGMTCDYVVSYESMYCEAPPTDPGDAPGPGPGPACDDLPDLECTGSATYCGELVPFDPDTGDGYIDYPENGETSSNQYRSFLRRDLMMMVKYAAAKVACKTAAWTTGNGKPLGLIDMSEANGAIPGTSIGQPGHPTGTHTNGRDIDVAYYQTASMPDNRARPICEHVLNGADQYHCVEDPTILDVWRSAAFLGFLFEHPAARVVGADGKAGPLLDAALDQLCQDGWLTTYACGHQKLTYEVTDQGYGWYYFHHHHMHISLQPPSYPASLPVGDTCFVPGCDRGALEDYLSRFGLIGSQKR